MSEETGVPPIVTSEHEFDVTNEERKNAQFTQQQIQLGNLRPADPQGVPGIPEDLRYRYEKACAVVDTSRDVDLEGSTTAAVVVGMASATKELIERIAKLEAELSQERELYRRELDQRQTQMERLEQENARLKGEYPGYYEKEITTLREALNTEKDKLADYQGRLWCALSQPSNIEFIAATKKVAAQLSEAQRTLAEQKAQIERLRKDVYAQIDMHQDIFSWQKGESRNALVCQIRNQVDDIFTLATRSQHPSVTNQ